jgi:hypothetical protein
MLRAACAVPSVVRHPVMGRSQARLDGMLQQDVPEFIHSLVRTGRAAPDDMLYLDLTPSPR